MRILYLAPIDPSLPLGHAVHLRRLTTALEARGHEVRWLSLRAATALSGKPPRGGWSEIPRVGPPHLRQLGSEWAFSRRLHHEGRAFRPDLLLCRLEPLTASALQAASAVEAPLVLECNSALGPASGARGLKLNLVEALERAHLRRAHGIGVVTPRLRDLYAAREPSIAERIAVIPNGAELPVVDHAASLAARRELGISDQSFLVIFGGSLNWWQGVDLLMEAIDRLTHSDVTLCVVGDGPEAAALGARAARLRRPEAARLLGPMPEARLHSLLQSAQLIVAPYRPDFLEQNGGEGLKVIQGLAADRPVLTSRGASPRVSAPALDVVEEWTAEDWAAALDQRAEWWIESGRPLRDWPWPDGRGAGRLWVERERSWDHSAAAWEPLFDAARARYLNGSRSR